MSLESHKLEGLRKTLTSVENWLCNYKYDDNRIGMIKFRHDIIMEICFLQILTFNRS